MSKSQREQIRQESRSLGNRLLSINCDAMYVSKVAAKFPGLPLIANERCGSWYVGPERSVYFKSTDGHFGKWDFSLRRHNLHILNDIITQEGCIIVDSTRSGKRMPDALAKTIPIWCSVINEAVKKIYGDFDRIDPATDASSADTVSSASNDEESLSTSSSTTWSEVSSNDDDAATADDMREITFDDLSKQLDDIEDESDDFEIVFEDDAKESDHLIRLCHSDNESILFLPDHILPTEVEQIRNLIPKFTEALVSSPLKSSIPHLKKPLRPIFLTSPNVPNFEWRSGDRLDVYPIILVSASEAVEDGLQRRYDPVYGSSWWYVQGAADDEEMWARGLDRDTFWANKNTILKGTVSELEKRVMKIIESQFLEGDDMSYTSDTFNLAARIGNMNIYVGGVKSSSPEFLSKHGITHIINCTMDIPKYITPKWVETETTEGRYLHLRIPEGKKGATLEFVGHVNCAIEWVRPFVTSLVLNDSGERHREHKLLIHCSQGKERSISILVGILARYFYPPSDDGTISPRPENQTLTKQEVQMWLLYVSQYRTAARVGRAFLKRLNSALIEWDMPSVVDK